MQEDSSEGSCGLQRGDWVLSSEWKKWQLGAISSATGTRQFQCGMEEGRGDGCACDTWCYTRHALSK